MLYEVLIYEAKLELSRDLTISNFELSQIWKLNNDQVSTRNLTR